MRSNPLPRPRGQNVVLLALMMLFMVLMVTMTIGLGVRIRQQHELQNLADAAAYSTAIETARAYNNAALVNRAEVSVWVAMAADQSLIDWTSYARGMVNAAVQAARSAETTNDDNCKDNNDEGTALKDAFAKAKAELFPPSYLTDDFTAGLESLSIQGAVDDLRMDLTEGSAVGSTGGTDVQSRLNEALKEQAVAKRIVQSALGDPSKSGVSVVTYGELAGAARINRRETDCDLGNTDPNAKIWAETSDKPGLCSRSSWSQNMLDAAMGTRGNPFVTARGTLPTLVTARLQSIVDGAGFASISFTPPRGSGYWADTMNHGKREPGTKIAWADDHDGSVTLQVWDRKKGGCKGTPLMVSPTAHLRSTDKADQSDQHVVTPGWEDNRAEEIDKHTMGKCTACPSVWVRTIGFQPDDSAADAFGQPKLMVALERDTLVGSANRPWELNFKFPFSATGAVRGWDGRGQKVRTEGASVSVRHNVAISTAMAYYHRRDYWEEFPNLLNPFWRATLVPVDVDGKQATDVPAVLDKPEYRGMRAAFDQLKNSGYKGLQ